MQLEADVLNKGKHELDKIKGEEGTSKGQGYIVEIYIFDTEYEPISYSLVELEVVIPFLYV